LRAFLLAHARRHFVNRSPWAPVTDEPSDLLGGL
jgi:hypothetical protein